MKKKLAFAAAIIHSPQILFLDEPFETLDPSTTEMLKVWLRRFVQSGRTVFLTTHILGTIEQLCDSAAILRDGSVIWRGELHGEPEEVFRAEGRAFRCFEDLYLHLVGHRTDSPGWL